MAGSVSSSLIVKSPPPGSSRYPAVFSSNSIGMVSSLGLRMIGGLSLMSFREKHKKIYHLKQCQKRFLIITEITSLEVTSNISNQNVCDLGHCVLRHNLDRCRFATLFRKFSPLRKQFWLFSIWKYFGRKVWEDSPRICGGAAEIWVKHFTRGTDAFRWRACGMKISGKSPFVCCWGPWSVSEVWTSMSL